MRLGSISDVIHLSPYILGWTVQGWVAVREGPFRRLEEALECALAGGSADKGKRAHWSI